MSVGNPQAVSYALVGIRALNRDRFNELSRSFHGAKLEVVTQDGCIVGHEPLSAVLSRIEDGEYAAQDSTTIKTGRPKPPRPKLTTSN